VSSRAQRRLERRQREKRPHRDEVVRRRVAEAAPKPLPPPPGEPPPVRCAVCNAPAKAEWFDTSVMQRYVTHPIAPAGWLFKCVLGHWRGHRVDGILPVDDLWLQAQLHMEQGNAIELALVVTQPGGQPQKVMSLRNDPGRRASGLLVAGSL